MARSALSKQQYSTLAADNESYKHYGQREDHYSNQGEMSQKHALGYGQHQLQPNDLSA